MIAFTREATIGLGILVAAIWFLFVMGYCFHQMTKNLNQERREPS